MKKLMLSSLILLFAGNVLQVMAAKEEDINSRLLEAARKNETNEVIKLLDLGACASAGCRKDKGYTPLHYAVYFANGKLVKRLLACGDIVVNAVDFRGDTPLDWRNASACSGNPSIVDLLKAKGGIEGKYLYGEY